MTTPAGLYENGRATKTHAVQIGRADLRCDGSFRSFYNGLRRRVVEGGGGTKRDREREVQVMTFWMKDGVRKKEKGGVGVVKTR